MSPWKASTQQCRRVGKTVQGGMGKKAERRMPGG